MKYMPFIYQKLLFSLIICLTSFNIYADNPPRIATSNTSLASIIAMLTKDNIDISILHTASTCPHHHALKPSDVAKVKKSSVVVYIDEGFDGFITKIADAKSQHIIKITQNPGLDIIKYHHYPNFHLWLELNNVKQMLQYLAIELSKDFPSLKPHISENLKQALISIDQLKILKHARLSKLIDPILLTDSLVYFFNHQKIINYPDHSKSIKYLANLKTALNKSSSKCLIISNEQNLEFYQRHFAAKIVQVNGDNWPLDQPLETLFIVKYTDLIEDLAKCL